MAYSCAMNGCGKAGRWDIALTLFTAMADNTTEVPKSKPKGFGSELVHFGDEGLTWFD